LAAIQRYNDGYVKSVKTYELMTLPKITMASGRWKQLILKGRGSPK
jgi:hypothetical protein